MSIDPQVRQLLDESSNWPGLRLRADSVSKDRVYQFLEYRWSQPYEEVAKVDEHVVDGTDFPVRIREYVGVGCGAGRPAPAILKLHGGGMVLGSPEIEDRGSRALANALRCRIFAPAYRLAPAFRHPAALDDCRGALEWLLGNGDSLGVDKSRVAVVGHSAGAMLGLAACLTTLQPQNAVSQVVAIEPMIGPNLVTESASEFAEGFGLTRDAVDRFWNLYLPGGPDNASAGIPARASDDEIERLPPLVVLTSELDPLRDEGEDFAERVRRIGGDVARQRFAGLVHGSVYYCGRVPAALAVFDAVVDSLRQRWQL